MANALQPYLDDMGLGYDLLTGGPLGFPCVGRRLADKGFAPPRKGKGPAGNKAGKSKHVAGRRLRRKVEGQAGGNRTRTWRVGAKPCDGVAPDKNILDALRAHATTALAAPAGESDKDRMARQLLGDGSGKARRDRQLCHYKRAGEK